MNFKKLISILLVLSMALCCAVALSSCSDDPQPCDEHNDGDHDGKCDVCGAAVEVPPFGDPYTVTVKDADGALISGVALKISTRGTESEQLVTGSDGKATYTLEKIAYVRATVLSVPNGYIKPTAYVDFADGASTLTITLEKDERIAHTVILKDNEGNPISGVYVQICQDICQTPVATDAEGKAVITFKPEAGYLKVKVTSIESELPGYEMVGELDGEGYLHYPEGTTELIITVAPVEE